MSRRYATASLQTIDEIAVAGVRWKPVRRTLGIGAFGINAYSADAGEQVVEEHDETSGGAGGHEELYLVFAGHARFAVDGEAVDAPAGTMVFVPEAQARRSAIALADGTTVLAVGGDPAAPYRVSAWEHWFAAEADVARGDLAAAAATVREGLPEHDGNASLHFRLACLLARDGQLDAALDALGKAYRIDPERIGPQSQEDEDLAALRGRAGFPPAT